jgi:hypothetical protein
MGVESYGDGCGGGKCLVPATGLPRELPLVKADGKRCGDHGCSTVREAWRAHVLADGA